MTPISSDIKEKLEDLYYNQKNIFCRVLSLYIFILTISPTLYFDVVRLFLLLITLLYICADVCPDDSF